MSYPKAVTVLYLHLVSAQDNQQYIHIIYILLVSLAVLEDSLFTIVTYNICYKWLTYNICYKWLTHNICYKWLTHNICYKWLTYNICYKWLTHNILCYRWLTHNICCKWLTHNICWKCVVYGRPPTQHTCMLYLQHNMFYLQHSIFRLNAGSNISQLYYGKW